MDVIKMLAKKEKELETDTNNMNIQSGYRIEFPIEKVPC